MVNKSGIFSLTFIVYQLLDEYHHFDFLIYFSGFFLEILPFLVVYTFAAFFILSIVHNKFLGMLITLIFIISMVALEPLGFVNILYNYREGRLKSYFEMNGYGHFMAPYLWTKLYWMLFGILLLIIASLFLNEEYIYYYKGAIAMYNLQKLIGEDKVNQALQSFINDWNTKNGQLKLTTNKYATSENLLSYILNYTSDENKDEVLDLFKKI